MFPEAFTWIREEPQKGLEEEFKNGTAALADWLLWCPLQHPLKKLEGTGVDGGVIQPYTRAASYARTFCETVNHLFLKPIGRVSLSARVRPESSRQPPMVSGRRRLSTLVRPFNNRSPWISLGRTRPSAWVRPSRKPRGKTGCPYEFASRGPTWMCLSGRRALTHSLAWPAAWTGHIQPRDSLGPR